jgi:hypothetical protein
VTRLAGICLIAHTVVHLAVWATPATTAQPFDPRRYWLAVRLGVEDRARAVSAAAAIAAAVILTIAGIGVMADAEWALGAAVRRCGPVAAADRRLLPRLADVQRRHQRGDHLARRPMSPKLVKRLEGRSRSR